MSRILIVFSNLDEFHLNSQTRTCSIAVPRTTRNNNSENRERTGDRSLGNQCLEVVFYTYHYSYLNDLEQEETQHMVARGQEEIPCCSLGILSGKQKKSRSISQLQLRSENTHATIKAEWILLALQ